VREVWKKATGEFDMTYGEFAIAACEFVLENKEEFKRHLESEAKKDMSEPRSSDSEKRGF
jgi:hypothetical protein